jgi:branched-chain amino acid aminotransferase
MTGHLLSDREGYIWINGEFVAWRTATVHVLTHSLHYSSSVFEGERAYNGKIVELEAHTERLLRSAKTLGHNVNYSASQINEATRKLLTLNNMIDGYVRPLVWRDSEFQKIATQNQSNTNIMIACWQFGEKNKNLTNNVILSKWIKPHPHSIPPQCKSAGSYQSMILALNDAFDAGYDDALLLDFNGFIAECTTTNIFFVDNQKRLITPKPYNILSGITRGIIIKLAKENNIEVIELDITSTELCSFTECFATGTAAGVKAIDSIDSNGTKHKYVNSTILPMISSMYESFVRKE